MVNAKSSQLHVNRGQSSSRTPHASRLHVPAASPHPSPACRLPSSTGDTPLPPVPGWLRPRGARTRRLREGMVGSSSAFPHPLPPGCGVVNAPGQFLRVGERHGLDPQVCPRSQTASSAASRSSMLPGSFSLRIVSATSASRCLTGSTRGTGFCLGASVTSLTSPYRLGVSRGRPRSILLDTPLGLIPNTPASSATVMVTTIGGRPARLGERC